MPLLKGWSSSIKSRSPWPITLPPPLHTQAHSGRSLFFALASARRDDSFPSTSIFLVSLSTVATSTSSTSTRIQPIKSLFSGSYNTSTHTPAISTRSLSTLSRGACCAPLFAPASAVGCSRRFRLSPLYRCASGPQRAFHAAAVLRSAGGVKRKAEASTTSKAAGKRTAAKMPPKSRDEKTIEERYQKKTQLEHILLRPDSYVGSTESTTEKIHVMNSRTKVLASTTPTLHLQLHQRLLLANLLYARPSICTLIFFCSCRG